MQVWMAAKVYDVSASSWECIGIFSSREKALAVCTQDNHCCVRFELDQDATNIHEFLVCTLACPDGEICGDMRRLEKLVQSLKA